MPDDQNITQNPTPEENSIPPSPQEPTEPTPENTAHSEPSTMPSEATESPRNSDNAIPVNNDNPAQNEPEAIRPESGEAPEMPENEVSSEPRTSQTAQTPVNEPLENETKTSNEQAKPVRENSKSSLARQLLISARNAIQFRKRKKLDRVMSLFLKQSKITNDEVEKFLHVSDATATRYLTQLEKENKIKQVGKTGKGVSYSRI
jgi:hypothetical protein